MLADEVDANVCDYVVGMGYEVIEIKRAKAFGSSIYRIFIDTNPPGTRLSGVTADDCAKVSRGIGSLLDDLDPFPDPYTLEVSSPGLFRELKSPMDFMRAMGKRVKVCQHTTRPLIGTLLSTEGGYLKLAVGLEKYVIPMDQEYIKVNLEPMLDFGEENGTVLPD